MAEEGLGLTALPVDWRSAVVRWGHLGDQSRDGGTWVALNHWNYVHTGEKEQVIEVLIADFTV